MKAKLPSTCRAAVILAAALAISCAPRARWGHKLEEWDGMIADFESRANPFVGSSEQTVAECSAQGAISGRSSLKIILAPGPYPGISLDLPKGDWREFSALSFECDNPSDTPVRLSVRIDDELSMSYDTRLNLENWVSLRPGRTRCVLPLSGVELGSMGSRGLNLAKISSLHLFVLDVKKPTTLLLDDVKLVRTPRRDAPAAVIPADVSASEGCKVSRVKDIALRLDIAGGKYPGISFTPASANWLGYDVLSMAITSSHERNLVVKVRGGNGNAVQCITKLPQGASVVGLPLHIVGALDLSGVAEVTVFTTGEPAGELTLSEVRLERIRPPESAPDRTALPEGTLLELDGSALEKTGKNTGLALFVYPPGGRPIVATPRGIGDLRQVIKLDGLPLGGLKRLPVAAYFFDHGMAHYASWRLDVKPGERTVWKPSPQEFAH